MSLRTGRHRSKNTCNRCEKAVQLKLPTYAKPRVKAYGLAFFNFTILDK